MPAIEPAPGRILAVLIGAGWFARAPKLAQGPSFENSARDLREYLLGASGLGLPRTNINWLFDDGRSAVDQLRDVGDFLARRSQELKAAGTPPTDLIVYYVGHGMFCGPERAYHLAIRATEESREGLTSIRVSELAQAINDHGRFLRKFLILDCCFAGAAYREFQSGALQASRTQLVNEMPSRGTALLCAASAKEAAIAPQGLARTMFSDSLLRSLETGHPSLGSHISLSELGALVKQHLQESFPDSWVRPEIHCPDQREGEVAAVCLFPNRALSAAHEPLTVGTAVEPDSWALPPGVNLDNSHSGSQADSQSQAPLRQAVQQADALLAHARRMAQLREASAELDAYTAVIDLAGATAAQIAAARVGRAVMRAEHGDNAGALVDYTEVIHLAGAPPELAAKSLVNRGKILVLQGDEDAALADYAAVLQMPGATTEQKARALVNGGFARGRKGDAAGELADYSAVIKMPEAPQEQVLKALLNRAATRNEHGDLAGAIDDYTRVTLASDSVEQRARALYHRARARTSLKETAAAMADYSALIVLPGAPAERVAKALIRRGDLKGESGDSAGELADYTRVIQMQGAPSEQVATALMNRGVTRAQKGDAKGELADYSTVIELPGAPAELVAQALYYRALIRSNNKKERGAAISDLTKLIELQGAPPELVAQARSLRHSLLERL